MTDLITEIKIVWCADDVLSLDDTLTPKQCSDVLKAVEHNQDATTGVSWDTLQYYIDLNKEN